MDGQDASKKVAASTLSLAATSMHTVRQRPLRGLWRFWLGCAKLAARGPAAVANDWQWLIGIPILTGLGASGFAAFLTARNMEVIMSNHPIWSVVLSGVSAAFGAFAITWVVAFVTRLVKVPAQIDSTKNTLITKLEEELRVFREPSLLIDYRPNEGEPFVEITEGVNQYRISIRSPVPMTDVELVANRVKTGAYGGLSDLYLRPMHDRNREGTKRVAVKADKEAWWDLVSIHPEGVYLDCIASLGGRLLPPGDHEFEIMATGGAAPPSTKLVKLRVHADSSVVLELRDGRLSSAYFTTVSSR